MRIYCISDNTDTHTGLRLAGIDGCIVHTDDEFAAALNDCLSDKGIGILLVTENLAKKQAETVAKIKLNDSLPLMLEIPDRHGTGRSPEFITDYIREAIGIKL